MAWMNKQVKALLSTLTAIKEDLDAIKENTTPATPETPDAGGGSDGGGGADAGAGGES